MTSVGKQPLEKDVQATIVELAQTLGWRVYHTHDSRKSAAGYPDLTLVRRDRLVFAELKKEGERPTPEQVDWLDALARTGAEVYVWTLAEWGEAVSVLSNPSRPVPAPRTAT